MQFLINFFAFRPTFSVMLLKIVWCIYLANTLLQTYISIVASYRATAAIAPDLMSDFHKRRSPKASRPAMIEPHVLSSDRI